jgi:hypothetical protein
MDHDVLVAWLREWATSLPAEEWVPRSTLLEILRQHLPSTPLPNTVLDGVLRGLSDLHRSRLLCQLGQVGRTEVLGLLRLGAAWEKVAANRLSYAEGLAFLNESEGLAAIEALYRESQRHAGDSQRSVPSHWVLQDVLTDSLGTPAALSLRDRLLEEEA